MRRLVPALFLLLAVGAVAFALFGREDEGKAGKTYRVVFDNGFGLVEGGDLKIGGVKAGETTGFELTETEPRKVMVTVQATVPGVSSLREGARCAVRQQSLIGEYFVDCELGEGREMPGGGTVPVSRTSSAIPIDLVNNVMRRPYRERFRIILSQLGAGLAGRPEELNEVIRRAHPALRETTEVLALLRRQTADIKDFIEAADEVSVAVEPNRLNVARWAEEASNTAGIQATRTRDISAQWRRLPAFLRELRPTAAQLERTADRQIPLLRKLQAAAPDLERFFTEIGPFSSASRVSLRSLGRASVVGRGAFLEGQEEIDQLRTLGADLPRLARPLRQFLQTIDDRGRSTENDPLAKETAPPAPDKTAYQEGQGFTGMEAIWNYFYYQTLATNAFDEVSHLLRIVLLQIPSCGNYTTGATRALLERCGPLIGNYQPGVIEPDPSPSGTSGSRAGRPAAGRERGGDPVDDRRGAGEPEAPATPGEPDPSKPQIKLPPEVEQLLKEVPKLPGAPEVQPKGDPSQLLDFLLAP